ncbi:DUF4157 domain-containing protein [Streptomyces cucumeris]|uniref:eCIS core domain-containing protein n=1 Tax=Streptomyces cucumeris TaxID=2962890 RepID=UPI003D71C0C8
MLRRARGDADGMREQDDSGTAQRTAVQAVLRSTGSPLAEPLRREMEDRLDADFSDVRVHRDGAARASAAAVGARAYTSGNHVVLGEGGGDKHTLAHELTHVIQQRQGPVAGTDNGGGLRISDPQDRFEREAEANATRVMRRPVPEAHDHGGTDVQRHAGAAIENGCVQRYTEATDTTLGDIQVTETGRFVIQPGGQHVWVRDDVPAGALAPALQGTGQQQQINGATYQQHWLGGPILLDCLHAAEEIINNRVDQLQWGGGEYSTIDTRFKGQDRTEDFGKADATNRRQARGFIGERNESANPQPGEAFVIVACKPDAKKEMSQFHAAAVVARDGQDCVALEVWSDNGNPPAKEAANAALYTVTDMERSFHSAYGGEGAYFGEVGPITVVVRAKGV